MIRHLMAGALAVCAFSAARPVVAAADMSKALISVPAPSAFSVNGLQGPPELRTDAKVQGGRFLRVHVPGKSANPWDISVSVPIDKPVKAGDRLLMVFSARLEEGEDGAATTTLPYNAVQQAASPYGAVFSFSATVGKAWGQFHGVGVATQDYKAGDLDVSIQLATARQVVDIGPVFVLDLGPAGAGK